MLFFFPPLCWPPSQDSTEAFLQGDRYNYDVLSSELFTWVTTRKSSPSQTTSLAHCCCCMKRRLEVTRMTGLLVLTSSGRRTCAWRRRTCCWRVSCQGWRRWRDNLSECLLPLPGLIVVSGLVLPAGCGSSWWSRVGGSESMTSHKFTSNNQQSRWELSSVFISQFLWNFYDTDISIHHFLLSGSDCQDCRTVRRMNWPLWGGGGLPVWVYLRHDGVDLLGPAGHRAGVQPAGGRPSRAPGPGQQRNQLISLMWVDWSFEKWIIPGQGPGCRAWPDIDREELDPHRVWRVMWVLGQTSLHSVSCQAFIFTTAPGHRSNHET